MSDKPYDLAVVIGRFQPVHNGHLALIDQAYQKANRVLILVGSAGQPQTYKDPFSFDQRYNMLVTSTGRSCDDVIDILPLRDHLYNEDAWLEQVQTAVAATGVPNSRVCLVGHEKDSSSYYLSSFPQWDYAEVGEYAPLNATSVRELLFQERPNLDFIANVVPNPVFNFLADYIVSDDHQAVVNERRFIEQYRRQFEHLQYPITFVTADAVVFCAGHVLMVRRGAYPGKGLWAFPGGFLDAATDQSLKAAALRELREETGIRVPPAVLESSIVRSQVFDAPGRSARGRTITQAFQICLRDKQLPRVRGGSDAAKAQWIPYGDLRSEQCFEDHYQIFENFLGKV